MSPKALTRLAVIGLTALIAGSACRDEPPAQRESWSGLILATGHVLFLSFETKDSAVEGTGRLTALREVGDEPLTLTGVRMGDSLSLVLGRPGGGSYQLRARYVRNGLGLEGRLDGGPFVAQVPIFRRE